MLMKKKFLVYSLLAFIVLAGLIFRIKGIQSNHSFWADEAYISVVARNIALGKMNVFEAIKLGGASYQPLYVLLTTISFVFLGPSEFTARLPVVLLGTLGIIFAFLVAKKLSNNSGGLLAAFVYAFSQLNLAHSTQAKPYAVIETLILAELFLILSFKQAKDKKIFHVLTIFISIVSTFIHLIGITAWIPYFIYIFLQYGKQLAVKIRNPKFLIQSLSIIVLAFYAFRIKSVVDTFLKASPTNIFFSYNNITYFRELLWKNYSFIVLPAIFGLLITFKKRRILTIGIIAWLITVAYLWNFKSYSHNIRYLIPFFGVLFVYFGAFWGIVGEKLLSNRSWVACLVVAALLFLGGYKIARKPNIYYSPNTDLYGDVQIADYKTAFETIVKKYPNTDKYVIFNDIPDAQMWYLNNKFPEALFTKYNVIGLKYGEITTHQIVKKPIFTSLDQFKKQIKKYNQGLLIVEDWESILPEEIKQYAKKNMKLEFRIEGLPQAQGDNWPIEVYSWGME